MLVEYPPTCRCCANYVLHLVADTLVHTVMYIFLRTSVEDVLSERKTFCYIRLDLFAAYTRQNMTTDYDQYCQQD